MGLLKLEEKGGEGGRKEEGLGEEWNQVGRS